MENHIGKAGIVAVVSAMIGAGICGCTDKEPEESPSPAKESQPYEITLETRPWLIYLKPADPNQISTSHELVDALSAIPPDGVQGNLSAPTPKGQLTGQVWVHDKNQRDKWMRLIEQDGRFVILASRASYTLAFRATGGARVSSKSLLDMLHEHFPERVTTRRYCTRKEDGSLIGYISTDTESDKDKLVSRLRSNPDLELVHVIGPEHD